MNNNKGFICIIFWFCGYFVQAQSPIKTHNHQDLVWVGYYPKFELGRKWIAETDFQFRRKDWGNAWSQQVYRQGLGYRLNETLIILAGFAFLQHHKNDFVQREYRPFQQLTILNNFSGLNLDHRYRLEQRFLQRNVPDKAEDGYSFNYRIRYKVGITVPIGINATPLPWSFYADNEIMVNFGEEVFINLFDQNRFSLGVNYQPSERWKIQLGYMNVYAQKARLGEFDDANIIRLNIYQKVKLHRSRY